MTSPNTSQDSPNMEAGNRSWAYKILENEKAGYNVPSIALQMAKEAIADKHKD